MHRLRRNKQNIFSFRGYSGASLFINQFIEIVGRKNALVNDIDKYQEDWTKSYKGGTVVCLPQNTDQVAELMRLCNNNKIGVVPQGGNTGLVGGGVGVGDEMILSLSKMNKVVSFDDSSGIITVESGVELGNLNKIAEEKNFMAPIDLGAKSSQIGGNVATNAGGMRFFRYGSLHKNVLGIEIVLANGEILNLGRDLPKDNMGYHLKNLFIGSEGTLGVITKVTVQLAVKPISSNLILIKLANFHKFIPKLLSQIKQQMHDILSAFEFIDQNCLESVHTITPRLLEKYSIISDVIAVSPVPQNMDTVYALIETNGCSSETDVQRIHDLLGKLLDEKYIVDAIVAKDQRQFNEIWSIRENVPVSLMQISRILAGKLYKYDISVNINMMNELVRGVKRGIHSSVELNCFASFLHVYTFGHVGDGNIHLNILLGDFSKTKSFDVSEIKRVHHALDSIVCNITVALNGSMSAEHGVGQQKMSFFNSTRSQSEILLMKSIKKTFDPNNIMNPGKIFII